jgi:regulator of protease activity HflC (stomatin/prohibitin superfamily)
MNPRIWPQIGIVVVFLIAIPAFIYEECRIDVPNKYIAILTHKTGKDLEPGQVLAQSDEYKGVMKDVLAEGRYYYNPYSWSWEVVPQIQIPAGKIGVRIRMYGEDLGAGELIASKDTQKGIVPAVLNPGQYAINACFVGAITRQNYAELIELHDMVTIPAGFKGLVTELTSAMPKTPNQLVSENKERGVQATTKDPGMYPLNPYMQDVRLIDCRSKRYDLNDIGFPTKDGFWVSLEAIIEFRVKPDTAAKTFILFNEEREGKTLAQEVINKVILPNARAYCRLRGSNHSGKEFITGETRITFQEDFQKTMKSTCDEQGIEIIQALITAINPPDKIADPVRRRQIALQQESQYKKEMDQQTAEQELAVQKATVQQKRELVEATQEVVVVTTEARKQQEVAMINANKRLAVAEQKLLAAKDQAAAIMAKGQADANVVKYANAAEAAGWQKSIAAFSGNGLEFARWTLFKKLAPAFRSLMINTESSPLMDVFRSFDPAVKRPPQPTAAPIAPSASTAPSASATPAQTTPTSQEQ